MNYYICERLESEKLNKTAGVKARDDMEAIFEELAAKPITIVCDWQSRQKAGAVKKLYWHKKIAKVWENALKHLKAGDWVYIQFPVVEHSIALAGVIKKLEKKGIKVALIIHDLELLRVAKRADTSNAKKLRLKLEEESMLLNVSRVVAHNSKMKEFIKSLGVQEDRIISLDIFDYLMPDFDQVKMDKKQYKKNFPVVIAGNLRPHKAQYVYHLPENQEFNLYGVGYEGKPADHLHYQGAFEPGEVPYALEGSFGLVWDGTAAETCKGAYGEYLKINNPHKVSLYLASELPVIIWKEAALADFILKHKCGIVVNSLFEIHDVLENMSDETYDELQKNVKKVAEALRRGRYTKEAIAKF